LVEVNVRILDAAAFTGRIQNYDYDMVLHYWQNSLSPGTEQYLYWSCEAANQPSRWNFAGICNPAIDELSKKVAQAKTREELVTYVHALDRILMWGYYMVPLYYSGADYMAYKSDLKKSEIVPLYGTVIETWWHDNISKKTEHVIDDVTGEDN